MPSILHYTIVPAMLMRARVLPKLRPQLIPKHSTSEYGARRQFSTARISSWCKFKPLFGKSAFPVSDSHGNRSLQHFDRSGLGVHSYMPLISTAAANGAAKSVHTIEGREEDPLRSSATTVSDREGPERSPEDGKVRLSDGISISRVLVQDEEASGVPKLDVRESQLEETMPGRDSDQVARIGDFSRSLDEVARAGDLNRVGEGSAEGEGGLIEDAVPGTSQDVGEFVRGDGGVEDWEEEEDAKEEDEFFFKRKPLCFYFTQNCCEKMEDPEHMSRFAHDWETGPWSCAVKSRDLKSLRPQRFDYFLVLDLEGQVEILEFPVVMVEAATMKVVARFHRFVRPVKMSEERLNDYIFNKYSRWYLDSTWHATAKPFSEVIEEFEEWLVGHSLWKPGSNSRLKGAAFVTCGNWDVKTKIPEQCVDSDMRLPGYFMEWINIKDVYLNHYKRRAGGMLAMMKDQKLRIKGRHHVGLDDAHNITRVLQRMLSHGCIMKLTATRDMRKPDKVKFLFWNRVK